MARTSFGQKANTRSASGGAGIPLKRALCNIPAFVAFWSPSTIELRASAVISKQSCFHKSAVDWLPSRLNLRLPAVLIIIYEGDAPLFSEAKALNIDNGRILYWQKSTISFPSYIKAFASLLIPLIYRSQLVLGEPLGQSRPPSTTITTDIPSPIISIQ